MKRNIILTAVVAALLTGFAGSVAAEKSSEALTEPTEQEMLGQPEIAGDGINNASQVEDPADIGREGLGATDAPEPLPVEGGAGAQEVK